MPQATTHSTSFHDWALKMERRAAKREVISWTMRGGEGRPLYAIQPYGVRAILLYESDFSGILPVILKYGTHFAQKWGLAVPPALWASI